MYNHSGNQMVDPELLFAKARVLPGMHVADFGCGSTGHIIFPVAKIIGSTGVVYAVDIQKEVLEGIKKRAELNAILNVHPVWTNLEWVGKTAIPKNSLDVIFIINVLNKSENRHGILEEANRLLKDKGRIVIVDWVKCTTFGPPAGRMLDFLNIKQWSRMRNFAVQEEFDSGPYHRGVILYKHE